MFATKTKIVATTTLLALMCSGACLADLPQTDMGSLAETTITMFPDGLAHDFGKVQRGTLARHAFRIVNTSNVSLEITSLRTG